MTEIEFQCACADFGYIVELYGAGKHATYYYHSTDDGADFVSGSMIISDMPQVSLECFIDCKLNQEKYQ